MGFLPPIIATLIADTKEYTAKMTEAQAKMTEFGASSQTSAGLFGLSSSTIALGAAGVAAAIGGYAVNSAYKFQEGLDKLKNQAGLTEGQIKTLGNEILSISANTGIAAGDLEAASLTISQAGLRGAAAYNTLNASAKAAVITNASVADTTKAIVAAQTLQIAKGMDVANLTGILVAGSKDFVGGLSAEEQMLSGRVGVALAKYGLTLKTIIPLGAEFAKVGLPTRSITSFANSLAALEKPMTDAKGKLTSYALGLEKVGLSQDKLAAELKAGNITAILSSIKDAATASGQPLNEVAQLVFGSTGSGAASVLVKNLNDLSTAQKNVASASATSLTTGFSTAMTQLGPQLKKLEASLSALMINAGKLLLPAITDVATWANKALTAIQDFFKRNPIILNLVADVAKIGKGLITSLLNPLQGAKTIVSGVGGLLGDLNPFKSTPTKTTTTPAKKTTTVNVKVKK